jgi:hypothetical protein
VSVSSTDTVRAWPRVRVRVKVKVKVKVIGL